MNTSRADKNEKATFIKYQDGIAYYAVRVPYSEKLYSFPVPLKEIDGKYLEAEIRPIAFMEYIGKAIYEGTLCKVA